MTRKEKAALRDSLQESLDMIDLMAVSADDMFLEKLGNIRVLLEQVQFDEDDDILTEKLSVALDLIRKVMPEYKRKRGGAYKVLLAGGVGIRLAEVL